MFHFWSISNLEIELYVIIRELQNPLTEMTTDHWFKIYDKNDDYWHIRKIQIKYTIIIIVQYTIEENVSCLVFQYSENYKDQHWSPTLSILTVEKPIILSALLTRI